MEPSGRPPKRPAGPLDEIAYALAAALIWAAVLYGALAQPALETNRSRAFAVAACP